MAILRYLAAIFIETFGITHPSPTARDRAARYIAFLAMMLFLLLCGVIAFAVNALRVLSPMLRIGRFSSEVHP
jgi:hypothetical protein